MATDVARFLHNLGLGQYDQSFRENHIDDRVLRSLTTDDLKELGVTSIGHRRLLLDAIAALGAASPRAASSTNRVPVAEPAPVTTRTGIPPAVSAPSQTGVERRQLTLMFCDLAGSTALSARLDPEDMREVVGAYHRCCADTITQSGGFVALYMGDGVLAYFGYPQADERDAENAVRAGLAVVGAVPNLQTAAGNPLQVRVGIATGLVVVGDLIGSGETQERGVIGETPNLAARLQALAGPDMVVIADSTRRLLGNLFELQDLGSQSLKGIAGTVRAWAALRESQEESHFEALHTTSLTALIGREEEFEALLRRWYRAKTGEGRVVLISGEAGIGKSRLTAALLERLASEPHTRLRYFCSPQRTNSAMYPFIGQMERAAGLTYEDQPQARLDKFDAMLARTATSPEDAALLAGMLSLPNDGRFPRLELSPEQRKQRTFAAMLRQLVELARHRPVLMFFEDAHWVDPTSLEMLSLGVDQIRGLPVLLVVTFRSEFNAPWLGQSHVMSLTLNRLGEHETTAIIERLAGRTLLPADVVAEIVARTDGIPLFVEEMTKAVLEAKSEGAVRRSVAAIPSSTLAVPASLHASLMARLDRLGPAKDVAQIGSVIGREFPHALLAAVAQKSAAELESALERLVQAGLLSRQGVPPFASYLFKHALVQDAAYGTLLRGPRQALHAGIVEALEGQFAGTVQSQPEILAHHCHEAGLIEKAVSLWGNAGEQSLARSALIEATNQLTRALDLIATLPSTPALRQEQIKSQALLITPLMHIKGYAATETKAAAEQARVLIEQAEGLGEHLADPTLWFSVLYGFWTEKLLAYDGDTSRDLAARFLAEAERQSESGLLMVAHRLMGPTLLIGGDFTEARDHLEQAIALYDPVAHGPLATRFGQDTRVTILFYRSLVLWQLGYPDAALKNSHGSLKSARETGQAATLMWALGNNMLTYLLCGELATAATLAQEVSRLAEEKGGALWKALGVIGQGCVLALNGGNSDATGTLVSGVAAWRATGATLWMTWFSTVLARAQAALGQFEDAERHIDEALTMANATRQGWSEAEIHRTAGDIALMEPEPGVARAQAHYERAIATARAQKAKSWELRAVTSLARLWSDQNKQQQARELLAPVYGWFTEGFDTADLLAARALLEHLPT